MLARVGELRDGTAKMIERLREEMEEHIALQTAENLRAGMSPAEARRQAVLKFGARGGESGKIITPSRGCRSLKTCCRTCAMRCACWPSRRVSLPSRF